MDKVLVATKIVTLIVVSSILGGMIVFSDVYSEVQSNIVSVICLSCIKLQPKTVIEFKFDTYKNKPHPDFVLDNLTTGPVFLAYRTTVCEFCDDMDEVFQDIFDVNYSVEDGLVVKKMDFNGTIITFIHINRDLVSDELKNAQESYMNEIFKKSVPMLVLITLGYDHGFIKPYYATGYGLLEKDFVLEIIQDGLNLYNQNKAGYHHH